MNTFITSFLREFTRHEGLALLAGALLTSAGIVCVAAATAAVLHHRSARARSLAWRLALGALLVAGAWKLAPDLTPAPVAVVEWQVDWSAAALPVAPVMEPLMLPEPTMWERVADKLDAWVVSVWLGVAALWMMVRVCGVWFGLRALARRAEDAPHAVSEAGGKAGLPERARYHFFDGPGSPMLTGWWRPVIWLPAEAERWDESRLHAVLRHEAAHWRRKDWLWQWVAQAAVCLWWWQPLAWLARRRLRMETEHAADDMAVAGSAQAADYARTLVEIAAGLPGRTKAALGVTMLGSDGVKGRVHALMRANRWRGRIGFGALVALAMVTVALSVLVATKVEFSPQKPMYRSVAKLVAGGHVQGPSWQDQMQDFYGTIVETLESSEMKKRALNRVEALHPNLPESEVEVRVAQNKGSAIFNVLATGEDPKFTKIFLDALLDEFIGFRQSIREQAQGRVVTTLLQETVAKQKKMEERNAALTAFASQNNLLTNTNQNNQLAQSLNSLQSQREKIRTQLDELKLSLHAAKGDWQPDITTLTLSASTPARPLSQMEEVYVKTKGELFVLNNERSFLLKEHKADHPEVSALDQKIAKSAHLLASVAEQIHEEMKATEAGLERQLEVITLKIEQLEAAALATGAKIATHEQLKDQAANAKEAYEKLHAQMQAVTATLNQQSDYVAIQERASPAAAYIGGSRLLPVWKLWRSEAVPKQASVR